MLDFRIRSVIQQLSDDVVRLIRPEMAKPSRLRSLPAYGYVVDVQTCAVEDKLTKGAI